MAGLAGVGFDHADFFGRHEVHAKCLKPLEVAFLAIVLHDLMRIRKRVRPVNRLVIVSRDLPDERPKPQDPAEPNPLLAVLPQRIRALVEIHVATPLEECERRDTKGLYARARRGDIRDFAGINDAYEPPIAPELVVDTSQISVEDAGRRVLDVLSDLTARP